VLFLSSGNGVGEKSGLRKNGTGDFSRRLASATTVTSALAFAALFFSVRFVSDYLARVIINNVTPEREMPRGSTPMDGAFLLARSRERSRDPPCATR